MRLLLLQVILVVGITGDVGIPWPYPTTQTPYPPETTPYPPVTTPYPPETTPYPPQTTPYPPETTPYPPQTTPYPPQTTPYPPETTPYPPATTTYPTQTNPPETTPYPTQTPPPVTCPPFTPPPNNCRQGPQKCLDKFFVQVDLAMFSSQPKRRNRTILGAKPLTIHFVLLLFVFSYAFLGGIAFQFLEADALEQQRKDGYQSTFDCVAKALEEDTKNKTINETVDATSHCWNLQRDERSEWGYMTATLYGFGIVTTLGYNRIAPVTMAGRIFCMVYGIIGIPITMIIIASVGQYLREFAGSFRHKMQSYKVRRRLSMFLDTDEELDEEASIELVSIAVLVVFFLYIAFGAWLLPLLNGQSDFFNGLYYNFLCLTAMDFGQLAPEKVIFVPVTLCYVCFGLAITTIAIEVMANYMRRLHFIGRRVKNVANTRITFGGKTLRVKDLLQAVGKKWGIDPKTMHGIDLDDVVERAIARREGMDIPEDSLEECHPQEPEHKASGHSLSSSFSHRTNPDKKFSVSFMDQKRSDKKNSGASANDKNSMMIAEKKNSMVHLVISEEQPGSVLDRDIDDQSNGDRRDNERKVGRLPPPEEMFNSNPNDFPRRKLTPLVSANTVKQLSTFFDKMAETSQNEIMLPAITLNERSQSASPQRKPNRAKSFTPTSINPALHHVEIDKGRRHSSKLFDTYVEEKKKEVERDQQRKMSKKALEKFRSSASKDSKDEPDECS
ncbi:hypothetical protein QR680_015712 [Steinernema hermaphroditum]|uniref:Potassium channel domain-containing protein n=1 Tax=Steinernema hermaphroditum TaxID=289476 RepID=A0AA39HAW2_9BILA|nr:hypothetical protein QR680_015712 [Steinernema hermaphroditum]